MKVGKLKELLKNLDDDLLVVLSSDSEGNNHSPVADIADKCVYDAETTYNGEIYDTGWSAEDACMEEDKWEEFKKEKTACVVLYPIN